MKLNIPLLFLSVFLLLCGCSKKTFKAKDEDMTEKYVKALDVLRVIQYSIEKAYQQVDPGYSDKPAREDPSNALNHLSEIGVEFNNSFSKQLGTDVSFWIVKGGGSLSKEKSSTFSYTFTPIKDQKIYEKYFGHELEKLDKQSEELTKAISSLGTCLKKYENGVYNLNKIELQVAFKVVKSASAGVDFKIGVVGISPEGELEWGSENTITLTFEIKPASKTIRAQRVSAE